MSPRPLGALAVWAAAALLAGCAPPTDAPADEAAPSPPGGAERVTASSPSPTPSPPATAPGPADGAPDGLEAVFFDVGQGDAALVRTEEAALLIDAGRHDRADVVDHLEAASVDALDVVAVTHPHADHIGQFDAVLDAVDVDEVWWSPSTHDTQTFDRALAALEASDAAFAEPSAGDVFDVGDLTVEVAGPDAAADPDDLHDAGLVLRVRAGDAAVLFTGDAEAATERRLASGEHADWLAADVYQVGHHGSSTSTTPELLEAVDPAVAVASYAEGNPYGHPHAEVVGRLEDAGVELYGTGAHGTVTAAFDGQEWRVEPGRDGEVRSGGEVDAGRDGEPEGCVDLNAAGPDELAAIVHVGEARAAEIVDGRPWAAVDELDAIDGIGEGRLNDILEEGLACVD